MRIKLLYVPRLYGVNKHEYRDMHSFCPPLGISLLTAALTEKGFSADQDDLNAKVFFENWDARPKVKYSLEGFDDIRRIRCFLERGGDTELEEGASRMLSLTRLRGYDLVGLSTCGQHNFSTVGVALVMGKIIKQQHGSTIVIGGIDPSYPIPSDELVKHFFIDFLVQGHGDTALLNLCHALQEEQLGRFRLDGVASTIKLDGITDPPYPQGMQGFYVPQFEGLPMHLYRYHPLREFNRDEIHHLVSRKYVLMLPYYFLVGCPFNCAFCRESYTHAYQIKPTDEIIEDLTGLKRKYRAQHFFFLNDMINPSREFAQEFSQALIDADLDIRWSDCAHFGPLDKKLLAQLRMAGAVRLIFGLESGSARLLRHVNKHFTLQHAGDVLKWSHDAGIWNEVEVVCGLPTETEEDVEATGKFLTTHLDYINYCHPNRFQLKQSQFTKTPGRFGLKQISPVEHDYHSYRFDEIGGLKWEEKEKQIQRSYELIEGVVGKYLVGTKGIRLYRSNQNLPLLFYLYDLLGNKRDVEAVIHDKWGEKRPSVRTVRGRSSLSGSVCGAYHRVRRMIAR